jgi:hypothetical protein
MSGKPLTAAQTRRIQKAVDNVPYAHLLGIELDDLGEGVATLGLDIRQRTETEPRGCSWRCNCLSDRHGDGLRHNHTAGAWGEGHNRGSNRQLFASADERENNGQGQGCALWPASFCSVG